MFIKLAKTKTVYFTNIQDGSHQFWIDYSNLCEKKLTPTCQQDSCCCLWEAGSALCLQKLLSERSIPLLTEVTHAWLLPGSSCTDIYFSFLHRHTPTHKQNSWGALRTLDSTAYKRLTSERNIVATSATGVMLHIQDLGQWIYKRHELKMIELHILKINQPLI